MRTATTTTGGWPPAPGPCAVNQADLDDNTDPARTALLDEDTRARLARKYAHAREVLAAG